VAALRDIVAPMSEDLLALFVERGALLEGHFLLSSGLHSPRYLQSARVLMDPPLATRLGASLADAVRPHLGGRVVSAAVSPALGGLVIGQEVARALGALALFTERESGRMTLRRGFQLAARDVVVVVEDVVTTGGSTREVIEAVRGRGAEVLAAAALIDRSGGQALPVPLAALLRLDVPTWAAESCPLCATGSQAVKPGSR
jgi:orotate phosphoribosyltransferase